jgi:hypothetical protein
MIDSNSAAPSSRRAFAIRPSMCLSLSPPCGASGGAPATTSAAGRFSASPRCAFNAAATGRMYSAR